MNIVRVEQADASNYCNLQGSNSSPKCASPFWSKVVQIMSKTRGREPGSCCPAENNSWHLLQVRGVLTLLIHFTLTANAWAGSDALGPRNNWEPCHSRATLTQAAWRTAKRRCLLGSGQNKVHSRFLPHHLLSCFMLISSFHPAHS